MRGSRVLRVRGRKSGEWRPDDQKVPILRDYLKRWKFEVGIFFGGVSDKSSDAELRRIAPDHPVFRVDPV